MKQYLILFTAISVISIMACDKDDDPVTPPIEYDYHAHIHMPTNAAKMMEDTMPIHIVFESHAGETVHHAKVRIFNKADSTEVYNKPDVPHIHETSGEYTYSDQFVLSAANGLTSGIWILEAKVWGHEPGLQEAAEQVEFMILQ